MAQERVSKLEAALRAVGEDDDTAPNLREALKRARQQAVPLSIPDKVAQCETKEGRGPCQNRPEVGVLSGRFRPTMRRGARVDPRPTEGSASGHRGRPSLRSGEDLPTCVFSSTGVAADLPRTIFCDAICSGEHGEVISRPNGTICVGPGRENHRCPRVRSSDDSNFAPLVSPPVASVGVLGVLATTQRDSASVISSDDECLVPPDVGRDVSAGTTQSDAHIRPTLMDGASPNCLGSGVRSELLIPTRRGRLVVEVAPNIVDVSAVALPGSPLFVTNVSDGEVVASHPWDSDEEDELDTHSRNRVDDDELLVPATVPASIGALREVGVESRNVVPRIHHQAASGGQLTESDHNISNGAMDRLGVCTQLDPDNEALANTVGAQPRMSEAFDLTIADSELSESPVLRARVQRRPRRVIREDSSEARGPGPNLLRRGRFAALAEDDTESVDK